MANSPSNEEGTPLGTFEEGEPSSHGKDEVSLDKIEEGESVPRKGEEPEHLVLDEFKQVAVWFMLQFLGALIQYWILLILSNGHGPA